MSFPASATAMSRPHPHYRCVAPLRLLLLRDSRPEFHARLQLLMDHNRERREADPRLWDQYHRYVTNFLRCVKIQRYTPRPKKKSLLMHLC